MQPPDEPITAEPAAPAKKPPSTGSLVAAGIVGVLILAGCVFGVMRNGGDNHEGAAEVACESFVKDRLKSPGSADFSGETATHDGDTWTVRGDVDSDNSFGAPIRNSFTCTISLSGDEWTLVSLTGLVN